MAAEINWIVAAVGVFVVMIMTQAVFSNLEHGPKRLLGNRDGVTDGGVRVSRAKRANQNMIEALLMFVPLAMAVAVSGKGTEMTAMACMVFVIARALYAPLYWFGGGPLRSLVWSVGLFATLSLFLPFLPVSGA